MKFEMPDRKLMRGVLCFNELIGLIDQVAVFSMMHVPD